MDFPSGHHPFASGQHHFASGEAEGVGNNGEELENKIRGFYLPKDYIRMGILRDGKKLFTVVFS